jgi:hypothetical protein
MCVCVCGVCVVSLQTPAQGIKDAVTVSRVCVCVVCLCLCVCCLICVRVMCVFYICLCVFSIFSFLALL